MRDQSLARRAFRGLRKATGVARLRGARAQEGITMLELTLSIALSAMMLAPLAAILWQVTAAPAQSTGAVDVVNQVRNAHVNVPDDVRSGQIFATGDDPVLGRLAWTNFGGGTSRYHTLTYTWDPVEEAMVRQVSIEGTGDSQVIVTRHLDQFGDVSIGFEDALPPFLLESTVNPEVETPLGAEKRTITSATFFRSAAELPVQAGGFAVYSTAGIRLEGTRNSMIGNVYANGAITVTSFGDQVAGLGNQVAGVLESATEVELRGSVRYYLHNDPGPPNRNNPSQGIASHLVDANDDPRGVAVYSLGFLVVDKDDEKVYKYDSSGAASGSFDLTSVNSDPRGITTDGSSVWVVDKDDDKVYRYDISGTSLDNFDLVSANNDPRGITTNGTAIWVVDKSDREVYAYDTSGTSTGGFDLDPTNSDARGITTDAASFWVVDENDRKVYVYDASGNDLGDFPLRKLNEDAQGITTNGSRIWAVDTKDTDDDGSSDDDDGGTIYVYDIDGALLPAGDTPSPG